MTAPSAPSTNNAPANSTANPPVNSPATQSPTQQDPVEAIVPMMPIILPLVGGVTMLLIAFIAVYMA